MAGRPLSAISYLNYPDFPDSFLPAQTRWLLAPAIFKPHEFVGFALARNIHFNGFNDTPVANQLQRAHPNSAGGPSGTVYLHARTYVAARYNKKRP